MKRPLRWAALATVGFGVFVTGCSSRARTELPIPNPPAAVPSQAAGSPTAADTDEVAQLIARSEQHFATGKRELALGHLENARREFDRAIDVLLESRLGARSTARLREHFDRLIDRIAAQELLALAQGDGFTEQRYEPAAIDQLLAESMYAPAAATPELQKTVEEHLQRAIPDVPIPLNQRVVSYVGLLQDRLRDRIDDGLARAARYLPMIESVFREEGVPQDLAYLPLIESAFKPQALSRASAKGIWQFMRATAREHGLKEDWYVDERSDPEKATRAAARYLRWLYDLFGGDWHLALASYNGGPGRIQRAMKRMKRSGLADFWSLAARPRLLPAETREYVPLVLAAIIVAKNPAEFGFDTAASEGSLASEKVPLDQPVDIRRVAEWTGNSVEDIRALNPELRRWTTPVNYPGYELKVPQGSGELLRARLAGADPDEIAALNWYTVRRGESLPAIARKLGVRSTDLAAANHLSARARVRIGQRLIIPRPPALAVAAAAESPEVPVTAAAAGGVARAAASGPATPPPARVVYRVKRGDTLSSIARSYGVTVRLLKSWNRLRSDRITVGDRLTIYPGSMTVAAGQ